MVFKAFKGGTIRGTLAERASVPTTIPTDTTYIETDTNRVLRHTGAGAYEYLSGYSGPKNVVYKIGTTYYREKYNGSVTTSSATFETIFQAALDDTGDIYLVGGATYFCSAAFTGFNIKGNTTITVDGNVVIEVVNGYSGFVFRISDTAYSPNVQRSRISIKGNFLIQETGTAAKLWTGLKIESTDEDLAIVDCQFSGFKISEPKTGIELNTSVDGWIANCTFDSIQINRCINGIDFVDTTIGNDDGTFRNTFKDVHIQDEVGASAIVIYGFKNVSGFGNVFINCKSWDMLDPTTQKLMTIAPKSINTTIIGGIIGRTDLNLFIDNSWPRSTLILNDDWNAISYGGLSLPVSSMVNKGRKMGGFQGTSAGTTVGEGIFSAGFSPYTGSGSTTAVLTYANGSVARHFLTSGTAGNGCGLRYLTAVTCRGWNPRYRAKVRFDTAVNQRIFFGFAGVSGALATSDLAGDDPLNLLAGMMIGARSTDTNFQIMHNNTTGATQFINTGIAINNTAIRTFDLKAMDAATNKWQWSIDGSAWAEITSTDIPAQGTALGVHFAMVASDATVRGMDLYEVRVETD